MIALMITILWVALGALGVYVTLKTGEPVTRGEAVLYCFLGAITLVAACYYLTVSSSFWKQELTLKQKDNTNEND